MNIKHLRTIGLLLTILLFFVPGCMRAEQSSPENEQIWLLAYFRQRYESRIEVDPDGSIRSVPLDDPMSVERLHYALSTDGRHWQPLNDNQPIWDRFVRDPFIKQGPDGVWHMLATGGGRRRDRDVVGPRCTYATSEDLINWKVQDYPPLMKDVRNEQGRPAGNIWAPKWFYDETTGQAVLIWSSTFERHGWQKSRLWYARTSDWQNFTKAQVLFDPPYSVIDGTLYEHDGTYYLFHKEEEFGAQTGERRAIRLATADDLEGPYEIHDGPMNDGQIAPVITEGPAVMPDPLGDGWLLLYDFCMGNDYGVSRSDDLVNWTIIEDVTFPPDARHGSVSRLTPQQAQRLKDEFEN